MTDENKTPVIHAKQTFLPVGMEEMKSRIAYVEQFVSDILVEGMNKDYGTIRGINRPCLFKAGAEKLQFGFSLEATYDVVEETHEPFRKWDWEWTKKSDGEIFSGSETGFYRSLVRCTLKNRTTGETWGSALGDCNSTERGRENSPANTVLKMASKRAHVGAILNATFTSDRFTQDVEDMRGDQSPAERGGGSDGGPDKGIASRFAGWCGICKCKHPAGTMVTKHGKYTDNNNNEKDAYVCVAGLAALNAKAKEAATSEPPHSRDEHEMTDSGSVAPGVDEAGVTTATPLSVIADKCGTFEQMLVEKDPDFDWEAARLKNAGNVDLMGASRGGVMNHYEKMSTLIGGSE